MTNKEVAEALHVSKSTVDRHWECARTWLVERIERGV
jgi:FixJ family two-component response regulator